MAYSMIHFEVAYRLLEKYEWITKKGDFMVGAVAPDAVHFHDNYVVGLKEKSHLWNCGPKWGRTLDSDKWKRNVLMFWDENKKADNLDFIAGYCVHILTDWLSDLKIWRPFINENVKDDNVEEIYPIYGQEAYGSDQWLFQHSNHSRDILSLLAAGHAYTIPGCIAQKDVERQKSYLLTEQYQKTENYDISQYRYCTEDIINTFIEECVDIISTMLYI